MRRRHILKHAVKDDVRHEAVWGAKGGFGAPSCAWFVGPVGQTACDLLSPEQPRVLRTA
jgi:hypothetical protein